MIPLARPVLEDADISAVVDVLRSGWLTQGPIVAAFEREFAAAVGAPHAVAVSSCTTALHLALRAVGIGPGDEVITASHSFIATTNAIHMCGAEPVFADIEAATFNIDPASVARLMGPRVKAILGVHQMGLPCDLGALHAIARAHGLAVVEDAACAIGSEILLDGAWRRIGAPLSDAACFSFHPRKILVTGEGGMIATGRADIAARCASLRQHAMSLSDLERHTARRALVETYSEPGYNYRMTDMQAALGRAQLTRLAATVAERRAMADGYRARLRPWPEVSPPREPAWARTNWQSYCVGLPEGADRPAIMQAMLERGVATRRAIMSSHLEPPWRKARRDCLATSERISATHLLLPLFGGMTGDEQDHVVASLVASLEPR